MPHTSWTKIDRNFVIFSASFVESDLKPRQASTYTWMSTILVIMRYVRFYTNIYLSLFCSLRSVCDIVISVVNPLLWIRIGFSADSVPAFYFNADPDPRSWTNADQDPDFGQTLPSKKFKF